MEGEGDEDSKIGADQNLTQKNKQEEDEKELNINNDNNCVPLPSSVEEGSEDFKNKAIPAIEEEDFIIFHCVSYLGAAKIQVSGCE